MNIPPAPQTVTNSPEDPPLQPPAIPELDWKSAYPLEAWKRIRWEGFYLAGVLVIGAIVAVIILRLAPRLENHLLTQRILCCALGGITGSWIYCVKWYIRAVTNRIWHYDMVVWRLISPFLGIFLAISVYVVLQTGLMGVTFTQQNAATDPKLYAYAIGFIVGLFSDDVMGKLTEVAKTLFGKSAPK